jgi:tetratricopeptide (TPR) repeat protein
MELARAALELDPDEPDALVPMGCALGAIGSRDLGLEHLRRSVAINPSSYPARVFLAWALLFMEQHEDALTNADAADRISPLDPANFHTTAIRAHALALAGESEQAYAAAEACDLHPRSSHLTSVVAAWCAVAAGRPDRAKFHNARLHAVRPDFRLEHYFALFPFQGEDRERIARHLRASGL